MSVVLTKESLPGTMHGRGGFPVKTVIYALFIISLIYLYYIYSSSQSSLREAELVGSRYKREAEERVTEIQELVRAKDRFQESCQNEKSELHNRIKSLNQQYSMVQSQYKETEADFIKLRQDVDTMKLERSQADSAHAAEYEKLKQEKETDIAKLKDDVADLTRQNQNLENTITTLRQNVKEHENAYRQLSDQYTQLQQKLQQQIANLPQQPIGNLPQQPIGNLPQQQQLQQQQSQDAHLQTGLPLKDQAEQHGLAGDRNPSLPDLGLGLGVVNNNPVPGQLKFNTEANLRPAVDDSLNAQHQMRPPSNSDIKLDSDDANKGYKDVSLQHVVNPNDEQKAQILGPSLDSHDKHQGGGEVDIVGMNVKREDEEDREKSERDYDAGNAHPNNPLALGQLALPREVRDLNDPAGLNKKDDVQQIPPLLNDENDQKEQVRGGENHYFGEDEEAQQQQEEEQQQQQRQQQEDERQRMEEDEPEEGDESEHQVDRFRDDIGDKNVRRAINPEEPGTL
ncbi:unnamed protein product [Candidula unifasciata]|uniref:Golgi integral membrane protein 4 n=1 Tax=Candidula unifasciata TaxID=100452 RepID=A0A8S4ACX6_9EUPU|nr:unnamed protein product [Candidula unifasciata]